MTILDLKMSLDRAHLNLKLCIKKEPLTNFDYFTTIVIDELLYPYAGTPDLFLYDLCLYFKLGAINLHVKNNKKHRFIYNCTETCPEINFIIYQHSIKFK